MILTPPVNGVTSVDVAVGGLSSGADIEGDLSVLSRVLDRVQEPPHGGAIKDYETWAKEVDGVTRAWARKTGDVVDVEATFVMDEKQDTIVPTLDEVQDVIDYFEDKRPAGSSASVFAPALAAVDFEIALSPNTQAVQSAVMAELEEFFRREGSAGGVTLFLSRMSEVISLGAGENNHQLIAPAANQTFTFGNLPVLGNITWSTAS